MRSFPLTREFIPGIPMDPDDNRYFGETLYDTFDTTIITRYPLVPTLRLFIAAAQMRIVSHQPSLLLTSRPTGNLPSVPYEFLTGEGRGNGFLVVVF